MGEVVVFSKSRCPHCTEAKALLSGLDIPFTEIDVDADVRNSMLMSRVSRRHTVPQIFFNDRHVGGASELKALGADAIRRSAAEALEQPGKPGFLSHEYSEAELADAVVPIKDVLDPHVPVDPTAIPEYAAVRIWYENMFGFLCNLYDQMILKPEPTALWMATLGAAMVVVEKRVGTHFGTACFSTAMKAGCSYCSAHGADLSMKYAGETPEHFRALADYLRGDGAGLEALPFADDQKVIINIASKMTTHEVTRADIEHARAVFGADALQEACASIAGMGIVMGFLNRFNDLVGVEIEASIKQAIDNSPMAADWEWGTHDTEDEDNRYPGEAGGPSGGGAPPDLASLLGDVRDRVFAEVAPLHEKYAAYPDAGLPAWIASLPDAHTTRAVSALYHAALNAGEIAPETKHLAAFALARGSGYPHLAAEEHRIAMALAPNADGVRQRLERAERFARDADAAALAELEPREAAALRLAKAAERFPHVVRGDLVRDLARVYSAPEIVELVIALAVIGIGQRWVGVWEPLAQYTLGR